MGFYYTDVMHDFWNKYLRSDSLDRNKLLKKTWLIKDLTVDILKTFPNEELREHYISSQVQGYIDDLITVMNDLERKRRKNEVLQQRSKS